MENFQHFTEHTLQEIALVFMAIVYALRVRWLLKFKAGKERQLKTGSPDTSRRKGILYSWANIMMPWAMESTRTKMFIYIQFALFHIGVVAAIGLSFIIPYAPSVLAIPYMVTIIQVFTGLACLIGISRMIRRVSGKHMRAISTPDDYFSLILLTVWFFFTTLSVPNNGGWIQMTYFIMTAFLNFSSL